VILEYTPFVLKDLSIFPEVIEFNINMQIAYSIAGREE
jgi:hypothetical protein